MSWTGSGVTVEHPTDNHSTSNSGHRAHARHGVRSGRRGRPVDGAAGHEGRAAESSKSSQDNGVPAATGDQPDGTTDGAAEGTSSSSDQGSSSDGDDPPSGPSGSSASDSYEIPSSEDSSTEQFASLVAELGVLGAGSDPKALAGGLKDALALKAFVEAKQAELLMALHEEFARQLSVGYKPTGNKATGNADPDDDDDPAGDSAGDADESRPRFVVGEDGKPVSVQIAEHADRMVRVELELAYAWSATRAGNLIASAHTLREHPDVEAAVASGRLELSKAQELLYGLVGVEIPANRRRIIDELLPGADRKTHGQLRKEALGWVLRLEPEAVGRRHKDRVARRGVRLTEAVDCVSDLQVFGLPSDKAAAAYNHIDHLARAAKAGGATRGLGQLRADIAMSLLLGQIPNSGQDLGDDNPAEGFDFDFTGPDLPDSNPPGGKSPTDGSPTGGSPSGESRSDGSPTDGSPTGGSPTGGSPSGESRSDGSPTDGSPTDGSPTGGSPGGGFAGGGSPAPQGTSPDADADADADADKGAGEDRPDGYVPGVDEDDTGADETREAEFGNADDLAGLIDEWFTNLACAEDCPHHSSGCECRAGGGCQCDCGASYATGEDAARMEDLTDLTRLLVFAKQLLGQPGVFRRRFTHQPILTPSEHSADELIEQVRTRLAQLLSDYSLTIEDLRTRYQQAQQAAAKASPDADAADDAGVDHPPGEPDDSPAQRMRAQHARDAAKYRDLLPEGFADHPDADDNTGKNGKPGRNGAGGTKPRRLKGWPAPRGRSMNMFTMQLDQYLALNGVLGVIDEHGQVPVYGPLTTRPAELAGIGPLLEDMAMRVITACLENPDGHRFALGITDPVTGRLIQYHPIDQRTLRGLQREASAARSVTCVLPTCAVSALSCDADHAIEYAKTLLTFLDEMDRPCRSHHMTKTLGGFTLTPTTPGAFQLRTRSGLVYDIPAPALTDPRPEAEPGVTPTSATVANTKQAKASEGADADDPPF